MATLDEQFQQAQAELVLLKTHGQQWALSMVERIVEATTRIFGEKVEIYTDYDPEYPAEKYVVFSVQSSASIADMLKMEKQWVREVRDVAVQWPSFRLLLTPTP